MRLWHRCRGIANGKWGWVSTEVAEGSYVQWDFNRGDYGHRHSIDMGDLYHDLLSPSLSTHLICSQCEGGPTDYRTVAGGREEWWAEEEEAVVSGEWGGAGMNGVVG